MKLGIMQPYFLPYIGYWQLLNAVDQYVIYDNIQFTKKGWIKKNRILLNGKANNISLVLKKDSDYLDIVQRYLSENFNKDKLKMLKKIELAYKKAPFFKQVYPLIEEIINYSEENLFEYILNSVLKIKDYLDIETKIIISSEVDINHSLKGENKVIEFCKNLEATEYYNAIGGQELYSFSKFKKEKIELKFLKTSNIKYKQFNSEFVSSLSILDVLMFNSKDEVKKMLNNYEILKGEN